MITVMGPCILLKVGCTDSADHVEVWELEDDTNALTLLPGIYDIEYEIINDGCEPSLNDIFDKTERWPPTLISIPNATLVYNTQGLIVPIFSWRDAQHYNATVPADDSFVPFSKNLWFTEWPPMVGFMGLECTDDMLGQEPYFHLRRIEVSLVQSNVVEIVISNDWNRVKECVGEQARANYKTIPREACSESYKTTYKLIEACIFPCAAPSVNMIGSIENGYPYLKIFLHPPTSCQCN